MKISELRSKFLFETPAGVDPVHTKTFIELVNDVVTHLADTTLAHGINNIVASISAHLVDKATISHLAHVIPDGTTITIDGDGKISAPALSGTWETWIPTLTWTTATPTGISIVAQYRVIGNICFYKISIIAINGQGATNLTITLPNIVQGGVFAVAGYQYVGASTKANVMAYAHSANNLINFVNFSTATVDQEYGVHIEGFYQI